MKGGVREALAAVLSEELAVAQTDVVDLVARAAAVHALPLLRRLLSFSGFRQASVGTHKTGIRQVKSGNPGTPGPRTLSSAAFEHSLQISHRHHLEKCVPLWQSQQSLIHSDFLYRHDIIILSRLGQQFIRRM